MTNLLEVTAEIIFHATEDSKKIFEPFFELFGIREEEFTKEKILGHYGNLILLAKTRITKKRAEEFVNKLVSKTSKSQIEDLIENIGMYIEDSSLFMRIGKNDLVRKEINLSQDNAVRIRIRMPIYKKDQIVKKYTELLAV